MFVYLDILCAYRLPSEDLQVITAAENMHHNRMKESADLLEYAFSGTQIQMVQQFDW